MKNQYQNQQECLSEQQDSQASQQDFQYIKTLQRMKKMKQIGQHIENEYQLEDEEPNILKPKILDEKPKLGKSKVMSASTLTQNRSTLKFAKSAERSTVFQSKKTIEAGGVKPMKAKRNDPVSLFQKTQSAWKASRFLKSGANNKEGRKLNLNMRNKSSVYL